MLDYPSCEETPPNVQLELPWYSSYISSCALLPGSRSLPCPTGCSLPSELWRVRKCPPSPSAPPGGPIPFPGRGLCPCTLTGHRALSERESELAQHRPARPGSSRPRSRHGPGAVRLSGPRAPPAAPHGSGPARPPLTSPYGPAAKRGSRKARPGPGRSRPQHRDPRPCTARGHPARSRSTPAAAHYAPCAVCAKSTLSTSR